MIPAKLSPARVIAARRHQVLHLSPCPESAYPGDQSRLVTPARSRSTTGSCVRPVSSQSERLNLSHPSRLPGQAGRSASGPPHHSIVIPSVPVLLSKQEIDHQPALWATSARWSLQTPPPPTSWATKAALLASYGFLRSVSSPSPQFPQRALPKRNLTQERPLAGSIRIAACRKPPPPSSFKYFCRQASRSTSSMSMVSLDRGLSPCPGGSVPNSLDDLDKELARRLKKTPT
ncbi:hypothetical protein NliqN6_4074 [Naganishia liquefaciens]|uniref:Uncharacterized protein n=1 Tax=Naganishia liquefaciens TaxID=104408 RepID=A0A8H3YGY2_9TREE|nr:hypothetical protein NliqN6_4074 [Naganishia liquefaciens]